MIGTEIRRDSQRFCHKITTVVSDEQLCLSTFEVLEHTLKRNVEFILDANRGEIEKMVLDAILAPENREQARALVYQAIRESVREIMKEMLRVRD